MTGQQNKPHRIIIKWLLKRVIYLKKEWNQFRDRLTLQPCSRFLLHPWHGKRCPYEAILFYNFAGRVLLGMALLRDLLKERRRREIFIEGFGGEEKGDELSLEKKGNFKVLWPHSPFLNDGGANIPKKWWGKLSSAYRLAKKRESDLNRSEEWERIATLMRNRFLDRTDAVNAAEVRGFRSDPVIYREIFNDQFRYVDKSVGYLKNYLEGVDLVLSFHRLAAVVDPALLAAVSESGAGGVKCIRYRGQRLSEKLLYHTLVCDDILKHVPSKEGREVIVDIGAGYGGFDRLLKLYRQNSCLILVDLPETLILCGYYLRYNFPDARIALVDDLENLEEWREIYEHFDFVVMSPEYLTDLPPSSVDLVLNTASMGFMKRAYVDYYLKEIERMLKEGGYFYSLNKTENDRWGIGMFDWKFRGGWLTRSLRYDNRFDYPQWLGQKVSKNLTTGDER